MNTTDRGLRRTALVVDDDPATVRLVGLILGAAGFYTVAAYDGREGLESLAIAQPDVVVLDLQMPIMDGWQALERIRRSSNVPVVVLTELGDAQSEERCLALGATDYVAKPIQSRTLAERVTRAAQGRSGAPAGSRHLSSGRRI